MTIFRECAEEIGVESEDIIPESINFLGLTRDLIRGGKPNLLLTAKINLSVKYIISKRKDATQNIESKQIVSFHFGELSFCDLHHQPFHFHNFYSKVDEYIEKHGANMSIDLFAAFALWCEFRTAKPSV